MEKILDAIMSGADSATIGALSIPDNYRAAHILASEATMWEGVPSEKKDPRQSVHVGDVATPELSWQAASTSTRCGQAFLNQSQLSAQ
jgi:crotonyl-CoA reductase